MTTTNLVTTAEVLAAWPSFANLSSTEQDALIAGATLAINNECDRVLTLATYDESYKPGRTRRVKLNQWPVSAVARVTTDLETVMTVLCTDTSASRASVTMSTTGAADALAVTGLTLAKTVSGTATSASFLFATYTTLDSLSAAINATSGWQATVSQGVGTWASTEITPEIGAKGALNQSMDLTAYVRELEYSMSYDDALVGVINLLEGRPDGYRYPDVAYGIGWRGLSGADPRTGVVRVRYTAGYATTDVPPDLKRLAIGTVRYLASRAADPATYKSEKIGDYQYERPDPSALATLPDWVSNGLNNYRRKQIA